MQRIPPVLDDALGFNLYRVALLFRRELMRALSDYELTPEQWQVMQTLWSTEEELNQSEVAHLTLRDKHTVSRILSRLERDGWIVKQPDPDDARAHIIVPTNEAQTLRDEVPTKLLDHFKDIQSVLDDAEEEELLRLLKKLRRRLRDSG
jgi:DNA-binding MarR family transcriptional regulator